MVAEEVDEAVDEAVADADPTAMVTVVAFANVDSYEYF